MVEGREAEDDVAGTDSSVGTARRTGGRLSRRDVRDHYERSTDHEDAGETGEDRGDREQRYRNAHRAKDHLLLVFALPLQRLIALRRALSEASFESLDERIDHGRFHGGAELRTRLDNRPQLVASHDLGHAKILRVTGRLRKWESRRDGGVRPPLNVARRRSPGGTAGGQPAAAF
jgi:hypothetical protein